MCEPTRRRFHARGLGAQPVVGSRLVTETKFFMPKRSRSSGSGRTGLCAAMCPANGTLRAGPLSPRENWACGSGRPRPLTSCRRVETMRPPPAAAGESHISEVRIPRVAVPEGRRSGLRVRRRVKAGQPRPSSEMKNADSRQEISVHSGSGGEETRTLDLFHAMEGALPKLSYAPELWAARRSRPAA